MIYRDDKLSCVMLKNGDSIQKVAF